MSILTEIMLFCDGGTDCPMPSAHNVDSGKDAKYVTPAALRKYAAADGWIKVGTKDYCDVCAVRLGYTK